MSIRWISLSRDYGGDEPDLTSLGIYGSEPDRLRVVGNLPHCSTIRPATAEDRDALVEWLRGLTFEDEPLVPLDEEFVPRGDEYR